MRPYFCSGPCVKHPGWELTKLERPYLHRSHRSQLGREQIDTLIQRQKKLLNLPAGYELAMVPGSATGAIEMGLWCFLGSRGVDVHVMDVFSAIWAKDIQEQLKIADSKIFEAEHGFLPELQHDPKRDLMITWSATSTGVGYQNADWITNDREGLVIVDATAAAFCVDMPFEKFDVIGFSWQKGLGSEAAHGMIALSPRAIAQLHTYKPTWPIPKLLNLWNGDVPNMKIFQGYAINTPSMLALADVDDALDWVESIGGTQELYERALINTEFFYKWVENTDGLTPMAKWHAQMKGGAVCFHVDKYSNFDEYKKAALPLENKGLAFDIVGHALSKPSFRVWCGPTIELAELQYLTEILSTIF
jgi:phosphoserine aminotransferase